MLACTLQNNEDRPLATVDDVGAFPSFLVITHPDGEVRETIRFVEHIGVTTIAPGQSKTWYVNLNKRIGFYALPDPGVYKLQWKWKEFKPRMSELSKDFAVSNEIRLLREEEPATKPAE